MKHEINPGDEVVFLYSQHLVHGECLKVNKKSVTVEFAYFGKMNTKRVIPAKVANKDDEFTVVWTVKNGPEGSYRIDYDTYSERNAYWGNWHQPFMYIVE